MVRRSLVGVMMVGALLVGGTSSAASSSSTELPDPFPAPPAEVAADVADDPFAGLPPMPPITMREYLPDPDSGTAVSIAADTIGRLGEHTGLAGQVVNPYERSLRVWWVGDVPAAVRDYAASRPNGVDITLETGAEHTRREMSEGAWRLIESAAARELSIHGVGSRWDGAGIQVHTSGERQTVLDRLEELTAIAGVRIASVTQQSAPVLASAS